MAKKTRKAKQAKVKVAKKKKTAKKKSVKKVKKTAPKDDKITLTEAQFQEATQVAARAAVEQYKAEQALQSQKKPVKVDISENVQLKTQLEAMDKAGLIQYGSDKFSLKIEERLTEVVIIKELLRLDKAQKSEAAVTNEESLLKSISASDPPIRVKFFNLQSPEEVIECYFCGPKGRRGPVNKTGHKKCPHYTLYPSEEYNLPLSVKEHLESLTFTHYKTKIDPVSGQIARPTPMLKPKYVLNPVISKADLIRLQQT